MGRSSFLKLGSQWDVVQQGVIALKVLQSQYMNNRIEPDHRRIKRRIRPMLGFRSERTAACPASAPMAQI
jgi:transposase-like protein